MSGGCNGLSYLLTAFPCKYRIFSWIEGPLRGGEKKGGIREWSGKERDGSDGRKHPSPPSEINFQLWRWSAALGKQAFTVIECVDVETNVRNNNIIHVRDVLLSLSVLCLYVRTCCVRCHSQGNDWLTDGYRWHIMCIVVKLSNSYSVHAYEFLSHSFVF